MKGTRRGFFGLFAGAGVTGALVAKGAAEITAAPPQSDAPFLGQIRAIHSVGSDSADHTHCFSVAIKEYEQWDGKEWVRL